jgi:hypothetical protein
MHDFDPQRLLSRLRFKHLQLLLALHQGGSLRAAAGPWRAAANFRRAAANCASSQRSS